MTDETPPTPPAAEPTVLQIAMALPEEVADFGLMEQVVLPPQLLEQMRDGGPQFVDMVKAALQQQFQRAAWSLATSLGAVLAQRAAASGPLDNETYIAKQSRLLEERRARHEAAAETLQADVAQGGA